MQPLANVYLTGFMGVGKTTIGRRLARLSNRPFLDLDSWIENKVGKSIRTLFQTEGEEAFRAWEKKALSMFCSQTGWVIALGGGTLMDRFCRDLVLKSGTLVYLQATLSALKARWTPAERPLLQEVSEEEIDQLFLAREPGYRAATLRVSIDGQSVTEVVAALSRTFQVV